MHWGFDCTNAIRIILYIYASDRSYGLDWIWVSTYVIIVDWVGLGHRVDGLDWIGFRKLDSRPTLI